MSRILKTELIRLVGPMTCVSLSRIMMVDAEVSVLASGGTVLMQGFNVHKRLYDYDVTTYRPSRWLNERRTA